LITKKISKETSTEKTTLAENVDLSNESVDLIEVVTENSSNKNEDEAYTEEPPLKKDGKLKKNDKLTKSDTEKPIKATEKPVNDEENKQTDNEKSHSHDDKPPKKIVNELEEELKKIKEVPQTTQKPTTAQTNAPTTAKKSSKNSAASKDTRGFIVLTSFVVFLVAFFL